MKSLKLHFESLLDDDDAFYDPENDKKAIEDWINNNYKIVGDLTISDDLVVDCSGSVDIKNKSVTSLTNGLFHWEKVGNDFNCAYCNNLTSLEGAPEKVGGGFSCSRCDKLTSLKGAPEYVGADFWCMGCDGLKSLEGAPKNVGNDFSCGYCNNLTSLKGAPETVNGSFDCSDCVKLKTLKGAPEEVGRDLYCGECPNLKITDSDRKKYKIEN